MRHCRTALIAVASMVAVTQMALAADLPRKAPVYKAPPPPPVFSWTGCYVGLNAGGAWGSADVTTTADFSAPNINATTQADSPSLRPSGFTGGGQLGCNYQTGTIVFGLEGDFDYFGLSKSQTANGIFPAGPPGSFTTTNSIKTDWLGTVRPRLGFAFDRNLLYVTGGLAVTNIKYNTSYADVFGFAEAASISDTKAGWTVGGGWEYAFNNNWSAKIEYLYMDFGHVSTSVPAFFGFTHSVHLTANLVRAGVNYRFTGPW